MDKDLTKSINYRNALKYLEENDYLVDFMVRKFYGCGTEPKRVSDKFRCAMRENYLRMRADDLLLGRADFLHCIREYILEDDGEYGEENFREWLSKGSDTLTNRENERKHSMTIPMTEELKAAITEAAREAGMTRATWVRSELIKILKEEK